ncbi:hypothetical protein AX14_011376 [Amanita brunnescens Koide BX004]|nr:hypothetical protein AX14_011376 [Amanita brunnescens Koide BX004]
MSPPFVTPVEGQPKGVSGHILEHVDRCSPATEPQRPVPEVVNKEDEVAHPGLAEAEFLPPIKVVPK